ncbi:hypothetical protein pb186bvf_003931 [Paramecium bursaria]
MMQRRVQSNKNSNKLLINSDFYKYINHPQNPCKTTFQYSEVKITILNDFITTIYINIMKNKFIAYGAITFVLGGWYLFQANYSVCYYLTSPKKKSYEISQFQTIIIQQPILQQVCDKLGISGGPNQLTSLFVQKLHQESINICSEQLIGISIIKRQQRRQFVEQDVQQYFDILSEELTAKQKLILNVMKQIIEYGKRDVLNFEEEYNKFLQVELKFQLDFNIEILRFKCCDTKILDKEELIKFLDTATDYLEQHSPQLYRFLKFIEENDCDKITGLTFLMIFSDDNAFFITGVEHSTVEESFMSDQYSSPIMNIPILQQKEVIERIQKFVKAKEFWSNE